MKINASIKRIVYNSDYEDELAKEMLKEAKIEIVKLKNKKKKG